MGGLTAGEFCVTNHTVAGSQKAGKDVVLVVVGNKCDLNDKRVRAQLANKVVCHESRRL